MANEVEQMERKLLQQKLFGGAPAPKTGLTPQKSADETRLFGGAPAPQAQPVQTQPVPDQRTTLGKVREAFQASNPLPMLTMGLSDYVPATIRRGVSAVGLGRPQDEGKSIFELKKQEQAEREALEARNPIAATIGKAGGLAGGVVLTPNIGVPRAVAALPYVGKYMSPALTGGVYSGVGSLGETGSISEAGKDAVTGALVGGALSPIVDKTIGRFATRPTGGAPMNAEEAAYQTLQKAGIKTPSQGVVTGDPTQLAREKAFGADIYGKMATEAQEAAQSLVGGPQMLPAQAAEDAVVRARAKALSEKAASDAAYKVAGETKGVFKPESIQNVGSSLLQDLSVNPDTYAIATNKIVQDAAKRLDETLGAKIKVDPSLSVIHSSMKHVEEGRQLLTKAFGDAKDNADRYAIRSLIGKFDDHIENQINQGAFSGAPDALKKWKDARKLWSEYQEKYGVKKTGSDAGSLMKSIIDEKADPVKVAEMIFNGGMSPDATMKKTAISVFDQMKRALGQKGQKINDIPELVNIKKAYLNTLMTPSGSNPADFARTAKQIDDFLTGPTRGLAKTMLEGKEAEALKNLSDAMKLMSRGSSSQAAKANGKIAFALELAGPVVGSVAMGMINSHPVFYGIGAGVGAIGSGINAYRGSQGRLSRIANAPYRPTSPAFPGSYTVVPRATAEEESQPLEVTVPVGVQPPPKQNAGGRIGRATGGKVYGGARQEAMRLVALAESMKKRHNETTKPLLDVDDNTIAKALAVANKGI